MKAIFALILTLCSFLIAAGQSQTIPTDFNLGFEKVSPNEKLADYWSAGGNGPTVRIDNAEKKSGNNSILIEAPADGKDGAFGTAALIIPANYQGKEIELTGYLKLKNVTGGFGGLWLRIDGDGGVLQFDNMQSRGLKGSLDWAQYTVKLPIPEEGNKIYIGALLAGKGQLWVDDLRVTIDGKDITEAKLRPPVVYKAASDKEFDVGSKITATRLTKSQINDLAVTGKVWGFLKYHHPAVTAGEHNWDYELFRIIPKVLASKGQKERNAVLAAWVEALGTYEKEMVPPPRPPSFSSPLPKLLPDTSWWADNEILGDDLSEKLLHIFQAKRKNKSYYIGTFEGVGNPQFKNEEAYRSMKYPDPGYRLLALFRYWNIIEYYFPNKHLIGENWNNVLTEFIPKFAGAADELEYKKTALALIGRIHDTHANIWGRDETLEKYRGMNSPPVGIMFVEEKAVVAHILDGPLAEKSGLKIGDVIESINGRKVSNIVKERLHLTPASNYPTKLRDIARALLRTNQTSLKVRYKRGNASQEIDVECYPREKLKISPSFLFNESAEAFKLINPDIAYLYPGTLKPGEIAKLIPEIAKTKGLVIDLRTYPSDFIVFSLGEFLMPNPTSFVKFSQGSITIPGLFTLGDELKVGKENNSGYYKGKVVIIINEVTQSQAEYTAMAFRNAPRATVIGSTTAGADGNVSRFFLPGGISTMISGIGVYYPDGRETQRVGIIPNIVVKPTIKGIAEGRDELLEKALEIINTNP
jgi:C-terminal processing protease CtpA/Prc